MPHRLTAAAAALAAAGLLAAGCGTAAGPTEADIETLRARTAELEAWQAAQAERHAAIEARLDELEAFAEGAPAELEAMLDQIGQLLALGMAEGFAEGFEDSGDPLPPPDE